MKIYKDTITGDEMFADTYKMKLIDDAIYEVYGRLVSRSLGDIKIDGFNPSAEEADEGTETNVECGVDVVLNHRLQECFAFGDKKSFTLYLKDYMKKVLAKLEENAPDQIDIFKNNMNKQMKEILGRFKDLQFFTGESMDCDGMVAMCEYLISTASVRPYLCSSNMDLMKRNAKIGKTQTIQPTSSTQIVA